VKLGSDWLFMNRSVALLYRRIAVAVFFITVLASCTQQLAQRSQSQWLKKNLSLQLTTTPVNDAVEPWQGSITTVLSGYLESAQIGELSGLAASHLNPGVFWAINDSGNRAELFAVSHSGGHIGRFGLPERNIDWEDLSSFQYNGKSWLAIADTGDNLRRRSTSFLYLVEEPSLEASVARSTALAQLDGSLVAHTKIEFSYEDGPQNVESIAVSVEDNLIYLVAKRGAKSSLYQLPLFFGATASQSHRSIAKRVGSTSGISWNDNDSWLEKRLGSRFLLGPTAMDISADNRLAVIANYRHLYLYRKPAGLRWSEALRGNPEIISSHRMAQSESVAFSADGDYIIVGSEGIHAPLLWVQ